MNRFHGRALRRGLMLAGAIAGLSSCGGGAAPKSASPPPTAPQVAPIRPSALLAGSLRHTSLRNRASGNRDVRVAHAPLRSRTSAGGLRTQSSTPAALAV